MRGATDNQAGEPPRRCVLRNLRNMGQDLFGPPDVAGWSFNLGWVDTASMLERFNYTNLFVTNRNPNGLGAFVTNDLLKSYTKASSKKTVKTFFSVLGPLSPGNSTRKMLQTYLETDDNGQKVGFTNNDATIDKKVRGLVHQIMCLPEFQLNLGESDAYKQKTIIKRSAGAVTVV